jgi:sugar/nucleoside kinase (ribokinase family)
VTAPVLGLFVGLTTLDLVHRVGGPVPPNTKVTATRQDLAAGGPAANAAVTFAALGGRARLVTALGTGVAARAARADLEGYGVEVVDVAPGGFDLAVSAVAVDEGTGERTVVSPDAGRRPVAAPASGHLSDAADGADVVLLDGHHPALQDVAARTARAAGTPVVLDAGRWKRHLAELLGWCDVVAASGDFRLRDTRGDAREVGPGLVALGIGRVAVTHGAAPVEWWDATPERFDGPDGHDSAGPRVRHGTVPVPRVVAVDTLGAGDAFHGALAFALAGGHPFVDALTLAAHVAARRVTVEGPRAWLRELTHGALPQAGGRPQ